MGHHTVQVSIQYNVLRNVIQNGLSLITGRGQQRVRGTLTGAPQTDTLALNSYCMPCSTHTSRHKLRLYVSFDVSFTNELLQHTV